MGQDLGGIDVVVRDEWDDGDDHSAGVGGGVDPRDVQHSQDIVVDLAAERVFDGMADLGAELKRLSARAMRSARATTPTTRSAS